MLVVKRKKAAVKNQLHCCSINNPAARVGKLVFIHHQNLDFSRTIALVTID